jgi:sulfatase maturation enzyme AslB (radical SAM superfamily)
MNKYCLETEVESGKIIHNFFTGSAVLIRPFEYINIFTDDPCDYAEFLVNNYFIVPEDFNEKELVDLLRSRKQIPFTANYLDHPKSFTILSTTKCNARCFYCYEMHSKGKTHMTIETSEKVAKYIINNAPKYNELQIGWFGGEPLFNVDVIDIITSRVKSAGFNIIGSMVTNGYLFNEELVKRAKYDWNIRNV